MTVTCPAYSTMFFSSMADPVSITMATAQARPPRTRLSRFHDFAGAAAAASVREERGRA